MFKGIVQTIAAAGILLLAQACSGKFSDESLMGPVPDRAEAVAQQPPNVSPPANPAGDDQPPAPAKRMTPTPVGR